jgi:hypothetical protein
MLLGPDMDGCSWTLSLVVVFGLVLRRCLLSLPVEGGGGVGGDGGGGGVGGGGVGGGGLCLLVRCGRGCLVSLPVRGRRGGGGVGGGGGGFHLALRRRGGCLLASLPVGGGGGVGRGGFRSSTLFVAFIVLAL